MLPSVLVGKWATLRAGGRGFDSKEHCSDRDDAGDGYGKDGDEDGDDN